MNNLDYKKGCKYSSKEQIYIHIIYRNLQMYYRWQGHAPTENSMCRHHCSRGAQGHAPTENFDILYRCSCILGFDTVRKSDVAL